VLALLGAAVLASATLGSCRAGSNGNGTFFVSFAPDMTITASGLEEALRRMEDLFRDCLAGTWLRPCTPEEEAEIERIHDKVVQAKQHLIAN
jgi:hypothetical protein